MSSEPNRPPSFIMRVVELFLRGNLAVMLMAVALILGGVSLLITPREEEPQIIVPLADVYVQAPGLSATQVERQIATRLEKILYQIDGVEYVYSASRTGMLVATVRFHVGEDRVASLVKIYNKIFSNTDQIPSDVTGWSVKPIEIDDVPILNISLWSRDADLYDDYALRRLADEIGIKLSAVENTNRVKIYGGRPRVVRVKCDIQAMAARQISSLEVAWALGVSNVQATVGSFDQNDQSFLVEAGTFVGGVDDIRELVVAVIDGAPVKLREVAEIVDGPDDRSTYTWIGFAPGVPSEMSTSDTVGFYPAVHIAVAKKKGSNAVWVADNVLKRLDEIRADHVPDGVEVTITRNYGETANAKVNELAMGLAIAILIVIGLIALVLGWREGLIVALAVPITFALTLTINYLLGYTINRVTLFALTLSLGLVVDDPIINVDNIFRHFKMRKEKPYRATLTAVSEVLPPNILASLTVIISFIPLFFITGMMGPYMQPMALNVPLSLLMSLIVAFTVTPWMSYHILKGGYKKEEPEYVLEETLTYRIYQRILAPFMASRLAIVGLLAVMMVLFAVAGWLGADRLVPLKMLPFDNKNEFQVVIDMPETATLERTDAVARELADYLRTVPEARDFSVFTGMASPIDFNGMVRQYYMRQGENVADIRFNLINKDDRSHQSHDIVLRIRRDLEAIADRWDAAIKIVESPPGPPVVSTVTAEIYGEPDTPYETIREAALAVADRLRAEPMVTDIDTTVEADRTKWIYEVDKEKAALSGVSTEDVMKTLQFALTGAAVTHLQVATEVEPLQVILRLPRGERSAIEKLKTLYVKGRPGVTQVREASGLRAAGVPLVQLAEIGDFRQALEDKTIHHKNLERVAYVFAEMAGRAPAEAIIDCMADFKGAIGPLSESVDATGRTLAVYVDSESAAQPRPVAERNYLNNGGGVAWSLPRGTRTVWDGEGEWKITLRVFRDLGIAFGAACMGIYLLLVFQTGSYFMPLILMISIPLTLIGIMPGFWLLNLWTGGAIGGFPNPTFLTATAMIGMIALAGIAVRNAILLIEFVHEALRKGQPLDQALIESGAVRFRPIFMTAVTAMLAAAPITLDPIFSGLAWALIFGLFISTTFTLIVVPTTYYLVYANKPGNGLSPERNLE